MRRAGTRTWTAIGGIDGLVISCDTELELRDEPDLVARVTVSGDQRARLVIRYVAPQLLDDGELDPHDPRAVDDRVHTTVNWWRGWSKSADYRGPDQEAVLRSALV